MALLVRPVAAGVAVYALAFAALAPVCAARAPAVEAVSQRIVVAPVAGLPDDFMRGVDISMLSDVEAAGGVYYNSRGEKTDLFDILRESGVNWIRLRVWNNPTYACDVRDADGTVIARKGDAYGGGNNSVATDLALARRAKDAGFKVLLDFHYSDTWADPGKQPMPQDWAGLSARRLNAAVKRFTRDSIEQFVAAGATPDAVQIGNELNNGFLWPHGKIWGAAGERVGGFKGFTALLSSASRGVRAANGGDGIKIVIHLADGGKNDLYRTVFDQVTRAKVDYDIIGLSFYTYWHGGVADLRSNLEDLSKRYGKPLVVVETAYAFTEENGDDAGNVFKTYSDEEHGYVPSVQGQATAVRDVIAAVASVRGGAGVFYWEPAWIPVRGAGLSATEGNTWENQAMFDFAGRALPSLAVWGLVSGDCAVEQNAWGGSAISADGASFMPYALAEPLVLSVRPGETPALPSAVKVVYRDDSERLCAVNWQARDWSAEGAGTVTVTGTLVDAATDGFTPVATVVLSDRVNVLVDGSFESGTFGAWHFSGPRAACFMEQNKGNAHSGRHSYKYWLESGFQSVLTQEVIGIPDGTYELSIWAMGGGGDKDICLFAADFDGTERQLAAEITNTGWNDWHQYTLTVPVTSGKVTVGISLETAPGCWGNFDDVELVKVSD